MSHCTILAFIEFPQYNGPSASSIEGYISFLRSQFKALNLCIAPLSHHSVHLAMRTIALNVPTSRKIKGIIKIQSLIAIISMCDNFPLGYIYKSVFLLAFFAFLQLSNLVPPSISSFSSSTHLCRGDIIFQSVFATLILKWSKTLQKQSQFATVHIPSLGTSPLYPLAAVKNMASRLPLPSNFRRFLSLILTSLGIDPSTHSFHSFRRSGGLYLQCVPSVHSTSWNMVFRCSLDLHSS